MKRALLRTALVLTASCLLMLVPARASAQRRGAIRLAALVRGLTVANRVMVIGMRPDDEDPYLLGWLSGTQRVETAFLSLTRGESAPNTLGSESGAALGVIRARELAVEHRDDDVKVFFTRAYDFGPAKDTVAAFKRWDRVSLVGDIVASLRSFRPHTVVVRRPDIAAIGGGEYDALVAAVTDALLAATDTSRYARQPFGEPWTVTFAYGPGHEFSLATRAFDPLLGTSPDRLAVEARGTQRVAADVLTYDPEHRALLASLRQGTVDAAPLRGTTGSIDSWTARGVSKPSPTVAGAVDTYLQAAESLQSTIDVRDAASALPSLAGVVQAAQTLRRLAPRCGHPSPSAWVFASPFVECSPADLDLDAFADRVLRDAEEAIALAAGVEFEASSLSATIAKTDTGSVVVTVANHGVEPIFIDSISVFGTPSDSTGISAPPTQVAAGKSARIFRAILGSRLQETRPWWLGELHDGMFPVTTAGLDGLARPDTTLARATLALGAAIPEGQRRSTDVHVAVRIAGVSVSLAAGPVMAELNDRRRQVQRTPIEAVPDVVLSLDRPLQWIRADHEIVARFVLEATSFSDATHRVALVAVAPKGARLEGVPTEITLAPRERRELAIRLTGVTAAGRSEVGVVGRSARNEPIAEARRIIDYPHIPPISVYHGSGLWLQSVDVTLPPRLGVLLVGPESESASIAAALQQLHVRNAAISARELVSADLTQVRTVVVLSRTCQSGEPNPRVFDGLTALVRAGGTVVRLGAGYRSATDFQCGADEATPGIDFHDHARATWDSAASVMRKPNAINSADWRGWSNTIAAGVVSFAPTGAYASPLELREETQASRSALAVSKLGRGTFISTTLTLPDQIAAGVPGALRLFINLVDAGGLTNERE